MYALDSAEDTRMRLHNTLCMYQGVAVLVRAGENRAEPNSIHITSIRDSGKTHNKIISTLDPEFFVSNYNTGFFNTGYRKDQRSTAILFERGPYRQQRQGLSLQNGTLFTLANFRYRGWDHDLNPLGHLGIADMLENTYPTWQKALAKVASGRDEHASCAFHRNWALVATDHVNISLVYRDTIVGRYHVKKEKFFVNTDVPGMSYLLLELADLGFPYEVI